MIAAVVFALGAALCNAVDVIAQHSASVTAGAGRRGLAFLAHLVRQPLWLMGWVAAGGGFACQALALHYGPLSVVQPLLVTELVFALVLRRIWIRQTVAGAAWGSAVLICGALTVFLAMAEPHGGHADATGGRWLSVVVAFALAVAAMAALGRRGTPVRRAALFATAASLTWALTATFIKATTDTIAQDGILGMFTHWPVYALAAAGVLGTVLQQTALTVGPLSVSQPLIVIVDPIASIALSVWLFDERFTDSPLKITVAVVAFAVTSFGIVSLSRTTPIDLEASPPVRL